MPPTPTAINFSNTDPAPATGFRAAKFLPSSQYAQPITQNGVTLNIATRDLSAQLPNLGGVDARTSTSDIIGIASQGMLVTFDSGGATIATLDSAGILSAQSGIADATPGSSAGSGFALGDTLAVSGGGGSGAVLTVIGVGAGGSITAFQINAQGIGYTSGTNVALTVLTGTGTGAPNADITVPPAYFVCAVKNIGAGTVTLICGPSSGLIDGVGSVTLLTFEACFLFFNGVNWWTLPSPIAELPIPPKTATYLIGIPDYADLPNSAVEPDTYYGPDTQPVSPGSLDDEFNGAVLSGAWSWVQQGNPTYSTAVVSDSRLILLADGGLGEIEAVTIGTPGTGFNVGDKVSVSGGTGAVLTVATLSGSGIATLTITNPGTGYSASNQTLTAITGSGTGATVVINTASNATYPLPRGIVQPAPATPWQVTAEISMDGPPEQQIIAGIFLSESATGKIAIFGFFEGGGYTGGQNVIWFPAEFWTGQGLNNPLSGSGGPYPPTYNTSAQSVNAYFQVEDDGTNLIFGYSATGVIFKTILKVARTTQFTTKPDYVGLGMQSNPYSPTSTWYPAGQPTYLVSKWFRRTL